MQARALRALVLPALALHVLVLQGLALGAEKPPATACANPALPRSIVDGEVSGGHAALQTVVVTVHARKLRLAVASTAHDRELGLMCVTALRPYTGMLFVFPNSRHWDFWMKNTLIPLDMVWLAEDGRINTIARDVPASTLDEADDAVARRAGDGIYVIELRAGEAARLGLSSGDRLTLPVLHTSE
ncbi:MAG: DUF192 domain-containing protein [Candidatus Eremiobacteraeota bacterium]|nr:DUF192 domain-containing protein [Candidatus Eremiobacteraeota bacterium]